MSADLPQDEPDGPAGQQPMPPGFYERHVVGVWLIALAVAVPGGPVVVHGVVFAVGFALIVWGLVSAVRSGALGHRWRGKTPEVAFEHLRGCRNRTGQGGVRRSSSAGSSAPSPGRFACGPR